MEFAPEREPPLCKGRWHRALSEDDGGVVANCLNCYVCGDLKFPDNPSVTLR